MTPSHVALIGELVAALREIDPFVNRVAELEKAIGNALPGYIYMDPPDGGNVDLPEQLERMATDAARYRWLRRKVGMTQTQGRPESSFIFVNLPQPTYIVPDAAYELDAAIDAKIKEHQS